MEQDYLRRTRDELKRLLKYLRACRPYVYALGNALEEAINLEDLLREDDADLPVPHPGWRP